MALVGTDLEAVCKILNENDVVAIPTETVYGLAGNIFSGEAISKIFEVKKRPPTNPLIVHIASIEQLELYACDIPQIAFDIAEKFWPGPLTLVLPKSNKISMQITAGQNTVAIRVPDHFLTQQLLNKLPFPLAAPSANPYGYISPTSAQHVNYQLGKKIKYILDGGVCTRGIESTIVAIDNKVPIILREGAITSDDIKKISGKINLKNNMHQMPITAGMSLSHYSPKTTLFITDNLDAVLHSFLNKKVGVISLNKYYNQFKKPHQIMLSEHGNLYEAAHSLYNALHYFDKLGVSAIIAELVPNEGIGKAINDRLHRAAVKKL